MTQKVDQHQSTLSKNQKLLDHLYDQLMDVLGVIDDEIGEYK